MIMASQALSLTVLAVTVLCCARFAYSQTLKLPGNGTLFLGADDWVGPTNDIQSSYGLRPLTWSDDATNYILEATVNATSSQEPCGFFDDAAAPNVTFSVMVQQWLKTGHSMLMYIQSVSFYTNASTYQMDAPQFGFNATALQQLGYIFRGPQPVQVGCAVQACAFDNSTVFCMTNLTKGGVADSFNLSTARPLRPQGSCQRRAYPVVGNMSIASIANDTSNPVSEREITCWYRYIDNVLRPPFTVGVPCPGDVPSTSCPAWDRYRGMQNGTALYNLTVTPGQNLSVVLQSAGLTPTPLTECKLCCANGLLDRECMLSPGQNLTISFPLLVGNDTSNLGNCPCLNASPSRPPSPALAPAPSNNTGSGQNNNSSSSGLSTGAIVGIAVGSAAVVVALLGLLAFLIVRKRKPQAALAREPLSAKGHAYGRGEPYDPDADKGLSDLSGGIKSTALPSSKGGTTRTPYSASYDAGSSQVSSAFDVTGLMRVGNTDDELSNNMAGMLSPPPAASYTLSNDQLHSLRTSQGGAVMLDMSDLVYDDPPRPLGRGGFGLVYAAYLKGEPVAVKDLLLTMGSTDDMVARFESILAEVKSLRKVQHPNTVRCLGVVANAWPLKMVAELCEGGDLHKALSGPAKQQWQWMNRGAYVALDICKGLRYLHEELKCAHCDVKAQNVLLTKDGVAKVADFGLARFGLEDDSVLNFSKLPCSPAYAAPEQLVHQEVSFAVDVFSFGVVLMELLLCQTAPTNRRYPALTPDINRPAQIVDLVRRCMSEEPAQRPKMSQVHDILEQHIADREALAAANQQAT